MSPWILRLLRCYATIIAVIVFLGPVDAVTDLVHDTLMRLLDDSFSTTLLQKDTVAKLYQQLSRKEKALLPSQNDLTALMGAVKEEALLEFQPKVSALLSELSVQNHQTSSLLKKRMPPISPAIIKEGLSRVASEGHSLSETLRSATGAVDGFVGHAAHGVHPHHPSNPHPHHPSAPREPHAHAHAHAPEAGDVPVMATGETIILDPSIEHNVPEPPQNIFPEDSKQSVPAAATAQNENGEALNQPPNPTLPESPKSNKQKIPKSKERESEASAKPRDPFWKNWPRKYRQFQALLKKFQDKMAEAWTKMFAEDAFLGKLNARFRKIDLSLNREKAIVLHKYQEGAVVEIEHTLKSRIFHFFKSKGVWVVSALMAIPGVALLVYDFKVKPKELPRNAWEDPAALENILRQGEF